MKTGFLTCQCGAALTANPDTVTCAACDVTASRAAAAFSIALMAAEKGLCVDPATVQADDKGRLVFMYREIVAA